MIIKLKKGLKSKISMLMLVHCFDLILYIPVNIFSVMFGWVFLGLQGFYVGS